MGLLAALAVPVGLYALDKLFGGGVSGKGAIDKASGVSQEGMNKAIDMIKQGTKEAQAFNAPYMNPQDFLHLAQLVRSGYFQTPYSKSFSPQQFTTPGFNFNPAAKSMGYSPYNSAIPGGITPPGLPTPPPYAPPPVPAVPLAPQAPMNQIPIIGPKMPDILTQIDNMRVAPIPNPVMTSNTPQNPNAGADPRLTGPRSPTDSPMTMFDLFRLGYANRFGSGSFIPRTYTTPTIPTTRA